MRNHEITKHHNLFDERGHLLEPGWCRQPYLQYRRSDIKSPAFRIKEWDYYLVMSKDFAVAFTISDNGYFGLESASFLDFTVPCEHTESLVIAFPMGRLYLPEDSNEGRCFFRKKERLTMEFRVIPKENDRKERRIRCAFKNFDGDKDLYCDITLEQPPMDSLTISTPWENRPECFYHNQKINCMRASGKVIYGGKTYHFNPETDFGTLDWGRGVWTYDNTWYWGSGNGIIEGKPFGFNLGYGFTDRSSATENIIFYDGKGHKLDDVTFHIPPDDYTKPWKFSSSDGRFEADFFPILDRSANMDFKLISSDQHQVFGRMNGKAVLDDGCVLEMKDFLCFAEKVHNKY